MLNTNQSFIEGDHDIAEYCLRQVLSYSLAMAGIGRGKNEV
jgi:hypothetical protein